MLEIVPMQLGPVMTNAYLIADSETKEAVVIDPAWDGHLILAEAKKQGWKIQALWNTHAHFDHIGGTSGIVNGVDSSLQIALHPDDLPLWKAQGGAAFFGFRLDTSIEPTLQLNHGQILTLGNLAFEVRHAPGHTLGHVIYYCQSEKALFSGDVIFRRSIGRTDLPGGSYEALLQSIHEQVLTLPDDVQILSGHMGETTVGEERRENPFLVYG